ncbi:MAG: hypothetical protein KDC46_08280 [Thermoleophilia bacterium]|nr:hypothetical protein [Thermoleophilia bacterium]
MFEDPEFEQSRHDAGLQSQVLCLQQTPMGSFVIVYAEGESLQRAVETFAGSDRDVDRRWFDGIERFTGMRISGYDSLPRIEPVIDAEAFAHSHT